MHGLGVGMTGRCPGPRPAPLEDVAIMRWNMSRSLCSSRNEVSMSICVNPGWRSARRSSSRKHFGDLVVAVEAGHHQQLLEQLGRLRQREELAVMHARGTR